MLYSFFWVIPRLLEFYGISTKYENFMVSAPHTKILWCQRHTRKFYGVSTTHENFIV